jgi:PadR family transcriptional regulator, regulatory protein PadR
VTDNGTLGRSEQHVLEAILQLRGNAYGVSILEYLEWTLNKNLSTGAVYTTLDRLEKKGFVTSWRGDPTPERGGRPKRFFKVQAPGLKALATARAQDEAVRSGRVPAILKPGFAI